MDCAALPVCITIDRRGDWLNFNALEMNELALRESDLHYSLR